MDYTAITDIPDVQAIWLSMAQTFCIFILILGGLKLVGRRVFAEQTPQDLIILLLIAESCDLGLTHEDAGFWGTVASVLTILFMGWLRTPHYRV